jgi:hypothetical protein
MQQQQQLYSLDQQKRCQAADIKWAVFHTVDQKQMLLLPNLYIQIRMWGCHGCTSCNTSWGVCLVSSGAMVFIWACDSVEYGLASWLGSRQGL